LITGVVFFSVNYLLQN